MGPELPGLTRRHLLSQMEAGKVPPPPGSAPPSTPFQAPLSVADVSLRCPWGLLPGCLSGENQHGTPTQRSPSPAPSGTPVFEYLQCDDGGRSRQAQTWKISHIASE